MLPGKNAAAHRVVLCSLSHLLEHPIHRLLAAKQIQNMPPSLQYTQTDYAAQTYMTAETEHQLAASASIIVQSDPSALQGRGVLNAATQQDKAFCHRRSGYTVWLRQFRRRGLDQSWLILPGPGALFASLLQRSLILS